MPLVIKPFTYANGTVADANEVNANFDVLFNLLNGNLDGENLANNSIPGSDLIDDSVGFDKLDWGSGENQIDGTETSYWLLSKGSDFEFRMEHENLSDTRVWSWPDTDDRFVGEETEQSIRSKIFEDDLRFQSNTDHTARFEHDNTGERVYRTPDRSGHMPSLPSEATTETGSDAIVRSNTPTLTNPTINGSPQIQNFSRAQHDHGDADEGGPLAQNAVRSVHVTQHQDDLSLDASQLVSGTLPNARVSVGNVTQHNNRLDHGLLLGRGDNDHPQYARKAINEFITGTWTFRDPVNGVDPVFNNDLATKRYVDQNRGELSELFGSFVFVDGGEVQGGGLFDGGDRGEDIGWPFAADGTADGRLIFNLQENGSRITAFLPGSRMLLASDTQGVRNYTVAEGRLLPNGQYEYRFEGNPNISNYTRADNARFWGNGLQIVSGVIGGDFNGQMTSRNSYSLRIWYELGEDYVLTAFVPRRDDDDIVMRSVVGYNHYGGGFDSNDGYFIGPAIVNGAYWNFNIYIRNRDDARLDLEFTVIPRGLA